MGDLEKRPTHRLMGAAGGRAWLREIVRALSRHGGAIREWIATYAGIAESKPADETYRRLAALLDATPDLVRIADPEGRMLYINAAGRQMLGIGPEEDISQRSITDDQPLWARELIRNEGIPRAMQEGLWRGETALLDALGREIPVSQVIVAHEADTGRIDFIATVARDISERKRLEEALRHQATHDSLTGLANRTLLSEQLDQALLSAQRENHPVTVLFIDLDGFKRINDTLGHVGGDEILRAAAKRLAGCIRETDIIARHGGDEFVVVLPRIGHAGDVSPVLQKIDGVFTHPFVAADRRLDLTCSIGIAVYPRDGRDAETLLRAADSSMYRVKELTRAGQLSVLRARVEKQDRKALSQSGDLHRAQDESQITGAPSPRQHRES